MIHFANNKINLAVLMQEYICDAYAKVEIDRLTWMHNNQDQLRTDLYRGIVDACHADDTVVGRSVGQRFILPSSFTGSQRYMNEKFQVCHVQLHCPAFSLW